MAEYTFAQMLGDASDAPETSSTNRDIVVPDGTYEGTIVVTNAKLNTKGKLVVGLKFRVDTEGPAKGGGVWANQYLSPESPVALNIFFETFEALGVPRSHWGQFGADLERAGADVATRVKGVKAQIKVEADGQYGPKVKYVNKLTQQAGGFQVTTSAASTAVPPAARPSTPF